MSKNSLPLISTITPCFKMKRFIPSFLENIPKQKAFDRLQVVLDHNEPDDEEISWIESFNKKYPGKIKHIIKEKVVPIGISMNDCIAKSDGDYLAIWNIDDERTNDSIEQQIHAMDRNQNCDIVHGSFISTDKFGTNFGKLIESNGFDRSEYLRSMLLGPFFAFRKNLLSKCGLFDEQLKSGADFDFAIRAASHAREISYTRFPLGYYLNERNGLSTRGDGLQETERTVIELRYRIFDKIDQRFIERANSYDVQNLHIGEKKISAISYMDKT